MDPLFWVAHGAMERVFQKSVFEGIFSDMKFDTTSRCSGHDFASPKGWLEGFYFSDESVEASHKTNAELTAFLDPTTDEYRDLINFVYDTNSYSWCADSETWFG